MSVRFVIDPLDFVRKAETHHGRIPLAEFERLQDFLHKNHGEILYQISGILDQNGKPHLRVKMEGEMQLCCQRCLGSLLHSVDIDTSLLLARTENELALADADDSVDAILATAELDVLDLIEEEIILSLSISSRHSEGECEAHQQVRYDLAEFPNPKNPFAVLKTLKKIQH
ncbi:MAG: DUF177 domain-containing protein [Nitrosomonas sp.]|nr:DUF177 domain-containing protein [Nitrosomonas sp.]